MRQDRLVGHDPQQFESFSFQTAAGEFGNGINFFSEHLVEDDADDLDAFFFEQGLVQGNLVDRLADAALGHHDDFGANQFGHPRVGQIEDGADAGVAGAFAKHEVLFPGNAVEGVLNAFNQNVVIR